MGLFSLAGRFLRGHSNSIQSNKRPSRSRTKIFRAVVEALEQRRLLSVTLNQSTSLLPTPESLFEGYHDEFNGGVTIELNFTTDAPSRQHKVVFTDTNGNTGSWGALPFTGSQFSGSFSANYYDDAMITATAMENVSGTWQTVWSQVWQVANVAPSNPQLSFTTDGVTGRLSVNSFDDPGEDDWPTMRYSFAGTYGELADHYSEASDTPYADFDVNEDEDGILWARLIDKNGGTCDANTQYTLATVNFSGVSSDSVTLNWNNEWGQDVFQWLVERAPFGGTFEPLDQVWDGSTSYTDTTVQEGTRYQYRVRPEFRQGGFGIWPAKKAVTTKWATPSNVRVDVASGMDSATVAWHDDSSFEQGFDILLSTNGGDFENVATVDSSNDSSGFSGNTTYQFNTLEPDTQYAVQVVAISSEGDSYPSATTPFSTQSLAATGLTVSADLNTDDPNGHKLSLTFSEDIGSLDAGRLMVDSLATGSAVPFSVESYDSSTYTAVIDFGGFLPEAGYQLRMLSGPVGTASSELGSDCSYEFYAWNGDANHDGMVDLWDLGAVGLHWHQPAKFSQGDFDSSGYVDVADVTIVTVRWQKTLRQAFNVWAISQSQIGLSWDDNASNESGWVVERSEDGVTFDPRPDVIGPYQTKFVDHDLQEGTKYWYRVYAVGASNSPAVSLKKSVFTLPSAPTGCAVSANSDTSAEVTWTNTSAGVDGFMVYRADGGSGSFELICTVYDPSATSYIDGDVEGGLTYDYRVQAFNSGGSSADSPSASVTTPAGRPRAP
jgi:hypothetical protein